MAMDLTAHRERLWELALRQDWPATGIDFEAADTRLTERVAAAKALAAANVKEFLPGVPVIIEGGGYNRIFLETQPMGGLAYANLEVRPGLNNQLLFLLKQRGDGRLAGAVVPETVVSPESHKDVYMWSDAATADHGLVADYGQLQGNALPYPAFLHYFMAGKPAGYLEALAAGIEAFDQYLWRTRDPYGEGVLQSWCIWDTGEDNCTRFDASPNRWPHDYPPDGDQTPDRHDPDDAFKYYQWFHSKDIADRVAMPFRSMDMMAYSVENRLTLALISEELGDGRADFWREQAERVRVNFTRALWRPERGAAFDRDRDNKWLNILLHNNLRCMYYGLFSQEQAREFVDRHLFNPDEFFTPMPLPSIAVNESRFLYSAGNNWSGAPQGLTWQRLPRALENYGMVAELTRLGRMFIEAICEIGVFPQQFDPFHFGVVPEENRKRNGYGPTLFAFLNYVARLHGVVLERDMILWSGLPVDGGPHTYTQYWDGHAFTLVHAESGVEARIDGEVAFRVTPGIRVVTDLAGKPGRLIGIAPEPVTYELSWPGGERAGVLAPNSSAVL